MCHTPTPSYSKYYQSVTLYIVVKNTKQRQPTLILRWKGIKLQKYFWCVNFCTDDQIKCFTEHDETKPINSRITFDEKSTRKRLLVLLFFEFLKLSGLSRFSRSHQKFLAAKNARLRQRVGVLQ